jgi:phosphoribosyl 1,2-cyclic phosphodiesterase
MKVRFWGVRGSLPIPGHATAGVGGNTACVELRSNEGDLIILDAGSGLRALGQELMPEAPRRVVATILISQLQFDHVEGLAHFWPTHQRGNRFVVIGKADWRGTLEEAVAGRQADIYFPEMHRAIRADVLVKSIKGGEPLVVGRSVVVRARPIGGRGGGLGYRVSADGQTVAYIPSVHHPDGEVDPEVVELARSADLLIHDAQLSLDERHAYPDWLHSSWDEAARAALRADVRQLALFHHSPDANDEALEQVEELARGVFPDTLLAREGLMLDLAAEEAAEGEEDDAEGSDKAALRKAARRIVQKLRDDGGG